MHPMRLSKHVYEDERLENKILSPNVYNLTYNARFGASLSLYLFVPLRVGLSGSS